MRGFSSQKELAGNISRGGDGRARQKRPHIRNGLDELGTLDVIGNFPNPNKKPGQKRERDESSSPSTGFGSSRKKKEANLITGWRASIHSMFEAHVGDSDDEETEAPLISAAASHLQVKEQQQVFGSWNSWQLGYSCLFVNTENMATMKKKHVEIKNAKSIDQIIRRGLDEVSTWKAREGIRAHAMHGRTDAPPTVTKTIRAIPPYIAATADVIEAQLIDRQFMEGGGSITASAAVLSYASCLSRAVHTLTGSLITSGSYVDEESTYRSRAGAIGLPEEVIELRRRVAHGGMPLLSEFRIGAALLLSYLHRDFWTTQLQQIRQLVKEEEQVVTNIRRRAADAEEEAANEEVTVEDMRRLLDSSSSEDDDCSDESEEEEEVATPVAKRGSKQQATTGGSSTPLHKHVGGRKTVEWCGFKAVIL